MCIKWDKTNSDYFNVSNGVRQGGRGTVNKLFDIYIDDYILMICPLSMCVHHTCVYVCN